MSKLKSLIVFSLFFSGVIVVVLVLLNKEKVRIYPQPTESGMHTFDKEEYKMQRQKWMDDMHRAAPDADWKKIDRENSLKIAKQRTLERRNRMKSSDMDTIAGGLLVGEWSERGSNNLSGRMLTTTIDWEDSTIYAASQGGNIWKSKLDGSDWQPLNDYFNFGSIRTLKVFPHENAKRILAFGDSPYSYFSDDEGYTWNISQSLGTLEDWGSIIKSVIVDDSLNSVFVLVNEWDWVNWNSVRKIYRSENQGESFQDIITLSSVFEYDIWTQYNGISDIFLQQNDTIFTINENSELEFYTTLDIPSSITSISKVYLTGNKTGSTVNLNSCVIFDGNSYIFSGDTSGILMFKGEIEGKPFSKNSFSASISNKNNLFWGGVHAYCSYDAGENWTKVNDWWEYYGSEINMLHADIPEIKTYISPQGDKFQMICTDGGIYRSDDSLESVQNISLNGLRVSQYYSVFSHKANLDVIFAGSQDQGFQRVIDSTEGLLDLNQIISGDYGHIISGDYGQSVWSDYPGFVIYFPHYDQDFNQTWDFEGSNYLWLPPLMEDPQNQANCYVAGGGFNGGAHIIKVESIMGSLAASEESFDFGEGNPDVKLSALAYSPVNNSIRFAATNEGNFFYSTDFGVNWTKTSAFQGPESHFFYGSAIVAHPTNSDVVYFAGSGYSNPAVYKSTNKGESFNDASDGLPSTLVYEMCSNEDGSMLFAATALGPFVYFDTLETWHSLSGISAPDQAYWTVDYIEASKTVRFGTYGRGIWDFKIKPDTTGSAFIEYFENQLSFNVKAFPNPFNNEIEINIQGSRGEEAVILFYDINGKLIHSQNTLSSSIKIGELSLLKSGVYILKLELKDSKNYKVLRVIKK